MRHFLFLLIPLTLISCREFYDEEFENDAEIVASGQDNVTYTATIRSSDPNLTQLTGDARIDVDNGEVKVNLTVKELPQNINQVHYSYSAADCSSFSNVTVPVEAGSVRTYQVNETLSTDALLADIKSTSAGEDIGLQNKSLVVKGYSNLVVGANAPPFIIACGTLLIDNSEPDETTDDGTTTTDDGTTVDDGTTLPTDDTTTPTLGTEIPTF